MLIDVSCNPTALADLVCRHDRNPLTGEHLLDAPCRDNGKPHRVNNALLLRTMPLHRRRPQPFSQRLRASRRKQPRRDFRPYPARSNLWVCINLALDGAALNQRFPPV